MRSIKSLEGAPIVVFDLEIKNLIGVNGVSWKTYDKMGISVGCAFDYRTMDYLVFMDDNIEELAALLLSAELVVGFNIIGFDIPLLQVNTKLDLRKIKEVHDVYYASRKAMGYKEGDQFPKGLRLDDHLLATFGREHMKTANGEEAPKFFQEKKIGKLCSYCLADVKREKMLFEHSLNNPVVTKAHGSKILELPAFIRRLSIQEENEAVI